MDVEVGLLSLPCELHAMMLVQLSWRDFASLRLANRPLADGAGLCMLERLKAAAAAYASPAYSKVLQHDKLASWPVRSGALAVLLPASEWAALVSTASPLLEFWLRHELVAPQPVYLQYLCAARPPDRAVGPRGDTSGSFYRPVVGPEQLAVSHALRQRPDAPEPLAAVVRRQQRQHERPVHTRTRARRFPTSTGLDWRCSLRRGRPNSRGLVLGARISKRSVACWTPGLGR